MRIRKTAKRMELFNSLQEEFVHSPEDRKGKWTQQMGRKVPIYVEIGIGKGRFLATLAENNSDICYVGIEKYPKIIVSAAQRKWEQELTNLHLICGDVRRLDEFFAAGEIDRLYINFCDPWPKKKHENRRLTSAPFLNMYQKLLSTEGEIHFKTDNAALFEFSLNSFSNQGYRLRNSTFDLHGEESDPHQESHVMTDYEAEFVKKGLRIYRCEALVPY